MKRCSFFIITLLLVVSASLAQTANAQKRDKQKWLQEMRELKHNFLIKEIGLNEEQQNKFFPVYDDMQNEIFKVSDDTFKMSRKIRKNYSTTTDVEFEKAAEALMELKIKEGEVQKKYFSRFKKILTPQQLYNLQQAERKFTRFLNEQHSKRVKKNEPQSH